jgi:hypothetical protein
MRENRPYGSEGGVGKADPDPYHAIPQRSWRCPMGPGSAPLRGLAGMTFWVVAKCAPYPRFNCSRTVSASSLMPGSIFSVGIEETPRRK